VLRQFRAAEEDGERWVYAIFSASLCSLHDVLAEVEAWTDREPRRQSAVPQQIAEQMVINEVRLHSKTDVPGEKEVGAAAESIKSGPVRLLPGRRQLLCDSGGDRVSRMRSCNLVDGSDRRPDKQRYARKVTIGKLWTGSKSLRPGMSRHG